MKFWIVLCLIFIVLGFSFSGEKPLSDLSFGIAILLGLVILLLEIFSKEREAESRKKQEELDKKREKWNLKLEKYVRLDYSTADAVRLGIDEKKLSDVNLEYFEYGKYWLINFKNYLKSELKKTATPEQAKLMTALLIIEQINSHDCLSWIVELAKLRGSSATSDDYLQRAMVEGVKCTFMSYKTTSTAKSIIWRLAEDRIYPYKWIDESTENEYEIKSTFKQLIYEEYYSEIEKIR